MAKLLKAKRPRRKPQPYLQQLRALQDEVEGDNGLRASAAAGWAVAGARLKLLNERSKPTAVCVVRDLTIWIVYANAVPLDKGVERGVQCSQYGMWVLYSDGRLELQDAMRGHAVVCEAMSNFIGILPRAPTQGDEKTACAQAGARFKDKINLYYETHP